MTLHETEPSQEIVLDYLNLFSDRVIESYLQKNQDKLGPYCNFVFSLIVYADEINLEPSPFGLYSTSSESLNSLHDEKLQDSAARYNTNPEILGSRYPSQYKPKDWRGMARVLSTKIFYPSGENVRGVFTSESILKALSSGNMLFRLS